MQFLASPPSFRISKGQNLCREIPQGLPLRTSIWNSLVISFLSVWLSCILLQELVCENFQLFVFSEFWMWECTVEVAASTAKSLQSCLTLCDPIDGSPPSSPVPGILQARTLEWVAISFSNAWKWKVKGKLLSRVRLFMTPWTAAYQAPLPMGFSRQEYWSGVPLPSPLWR